MLIKNKEIFANLIIKSSTENNGDLIHKYIKKITNNFSIYDSLEEVLDYVFEINFFVGCREYIRLKDISNDDSFDNGNVLLDILESISKEKIKYKINECLNNKNKKKNAEGLLGLYAINDLDSSSKFFLNGNKRHLYVEYLENLFFYDLDLQSHTYDIICFVLNSIKELNDFSASNCIHAIRLNPDTLKNLMKYKYNEICALSKWFYQRDMYLSLYELMRSFERFESNNIRSKSRVYEFIGVDKKEFLEKTFANMTVKSLDLHFSVKYSEEFPELEDVKYIINCGKTQAVFCILLKCLHNILKEGIVTKKVKDILFYIKRGLKNKTLTYDLFYSYKDDGMRLGQIDENILMCFQKLCSNEQDVLDFVSLVSFFNVYGNQELRIDYNISQSRLTKNADWEKEYTYICNKYSSAKDIGYLVMNTYLRFFVDPFDLYNKCGGLISNYWFAGYLTNTGMIRLVQEKNNSQLHNYRIVVNGWKYLKKSPEEVQNIRFKIERIDNLNRIIYIGDIQKIRNQLKKVISNAIYYRLKNGDIDLVYIFLKKFEKERLDDNLYRSDRFVSLGEDYSKDLSTVEQLFTSPNYSKAHLNYIYMNSFLKSCIPLETVGSILCDEEFYLANLLWEDNQYYDMSDFFYIRPNYCTKEHNIISIKKDFVAVEFRNFIYKQIEWMKRKSEKNSGERASFQLRVCFKAKWNEKQFDDSLVSEMYLHCCESKITDLSMAINVYYHRVHKIYRDGLSRKILLGYISEYKNYLEKHASNPDDMLRQFVFKYYDLLLLEIQTIMDNPKGMSRWYFKDGAYNTINLFVMLDDILFGYEYYNNSPFIELLIDCPGYMKVLYELKTCEIIRKCVYEKTLLKYTSNNYDDFEDKIFDSHY